MQKKKDILSGKDYAIRGLRGAVVLISHLLNTKES